MIRWWLLLAWALVAWRGGLAVVWIAREDVLGVFVGCSELFAVGLGLWNVLKARVWDTSPGALVCAASHVAAGYVSPGVGAALWVVQAVVVVVVFQWVLRAWFGARFSLGVPNFVSLAEFGPYRVIRHPQMALCVVLRVLVLVSNPTVENVRWFAAYVGLVVVGVLSEERFLARVPVWRRYAGEVRYRLVPGVW